jgi:iron complex outermembrane receptor protein
MTLPKERFVISGWKAAAGVFSACGVLMTLSSAAIAQEDGQSSAVADENTEAEGRFGTIIVTAQRKSESVQDVPASITALDSSALEERGIGDVAALQFAVPSLALGRSLGVTQVSIRGVGRSVGDPGVAVNIDGVYQPRNIPMILTQTDLDRVEVLRGPQGTLYGRNANGGAVNFISSAPSDELSGYIKASIAEYNETGLELVTNIPVSDRVRMRLALNASQREEGFVENISGGEDLDTHETLSGRFRIAADLTSDLSVDLNFSAFKSQGAADYYVPTGAPNDRGLSLNPIIATAEIPTDYFETSALGPTSSDRSFQAVTGTVDWAIGGVDLKSITSYQRMDNTWEMDRDGTDIPLVDSIADENSETFSQEVTLSGATGQADWVTGLYYYNDEYSQNTFFEFPLGFTPLPTGSYLSLISPTETETTAAFADVTWSVSERFRLIGGARYSSDSISVFQDNSVGFLSTGAPFLLTCPAVTTTLEDESTTYRLGAQFDLYESGQIYFTNSTGWKAGGTNYSGCGNTFDPETITAFEGGFKGALFDGNMVLNAAAFYYDYKDFQVREVVGIASNITNAGSATVEGVEVEVNVAPTDNLTLNGSLSLLNATYGDFINTDSLNPDLGPQDLNGRFLSSAPEVSANFGIQHEAELGGKGFLTTRADVSYRSEQFFREFNTPEEKQDGYSIVNANLIWSSSDRSYSARLFANNLFDEGYWTAMLAVDGFGGLAGTYGTPRQIGLELTARY